MQFSLTQTAVYLFVSTTFFAGPSRTTMAGHTLRHENNEYHIAVSSNWQISPQDATDDALRQLSQILLPLIGEHTPPEGIQSKGNGPLLQRLLQNCRDDIETKKRPYGDLYRVTTTGTLPDAMIQEISIAIQSKHRQARLESLAMLGLITGGFLTSAWMLIKLDHATQGDRRTLLGFASLTLIVGTIWAICLNLF